MAKTFKTNNQSSLTTNSNIMQSKTDKSLRAKPSNFLALLPNQFSSLSKNPILNTQINIFFKKQRQALTLLNRLTINIKDPIIKTNLENKSSLLNKIKILTLAKSKQLNYISPTKVGTTDELFKLLTPDQLHTIESGILTAKKITFSKRIKELVLLTQNKGSTISDSRAVEILKQKEINSKKLRAIQPWEIANDRIMFKAIEIILRGFNQKTRRVLRSYNSTTHSDVNQVFSEFLTKLLLPLAARAGVTAKIQKLMGAPQQRIKLWLGEKPPSKTRIIQIPIKTNEKVILEKQKKNKPKKINKSTKPLLS
jgi:hypothetical protein